MKKKWQILPEINEEFINKHPDYNRVVLQLLYNRDIKSREEIDYFLNSNYEKDSLDPYLFNQMNEAVELIIKHIKTGNKIVVYGDYDADGVTASAIVKETLEIFKANIEAYLPDRVTEGYGLNKAAIKEIFENNAKLIITVDTGIRNVEEVEYAKSLGVDIVITDHHPSSEGENNLPDCIIINSTLENEKYPFKKLAGAGVAFKLVKALIDKSSLSDIDKKILEERIMDLVAVGTIADMVPLIGENRIITKKGLEVLNQTKRLGLLELLKVSKLDNGKKLDSWNIGFQIAPRLNAAGRLDHANTAYELLVSKDINESRNIAKQLDERNTERQKVTEKIVEEVESQIEDSDLKIIIGLCPPEIKAWNEGVVGLVAGKICEKYYRPTMIITKTDEGYKGSGRSIKEFNIAKALEECSEYLDKFGGHPAACGFSFFEDNKDDFIKKMREIADRELGGLTLEPEIVIDCNLGIEEVSDELNQEIQKFAPFGQSNPKPRFITRKVQIKDVMTMGMEGQHIKFRFNGLWGLAFGKAEDWKNFKIGDTVDIVYYIEENEFNGRKELQLKLVDVKV